MAPLLVLALLVVVGALVAQGRDDGGPREAQQASCEVDPAPTRTGRTAPPARRPGVQVWVTTPDRSELLHHRAPVAFGARVPAGGPTIVVDPSRTFQRMDGFGASMTDSSAAVLNRLAPAPRDAVVRELFDPVSGIGLSFLRQPIGSSDFTAASRHHSLDDVPAGRTDLPLEHFSIDRDEEQVLPLLRRAVELNPDLTVMGTPWSPPAWMKTSGSLVGGRLEDDPAVVEAYARYLVRFVQAYAAAGVPVDYLSVQNEPQLRHPDGYPGTDMPVRTQIAVVEALGPDLAVACPGVGILGFDHNWDTHPADLAADRGRPVAEDYPHQLLASPASRWLAGTAFHGYAGDPSAMSALHEAFPGKGVWLTELSGSRARGQSTAQAFASTLDWQARNLTIASSRSWAKAVVGWNVALDENHGPHLGGCTTCTGLLTIHPDGTTTRNAEYYALAHLSKFVPPGAVRVASTSGAATGDGDVTDVAFRNPDGSTALVVHNEARGPTSFTVAVRERSFRYTLPAGALATFTWPA